MGLLHNHLLCCGRYSRMVDKLSRGSNSNSFKTVSIDIGVIAGQSYRNTKNCNIDQKERKKKKHLISHLKKKFYVNSTEMYMLLASQNRHFICQNRVHAITCLIFIQPGACSARY